MEARSDSLRMSLPPANKSISVPLPSAHPLPERTLPARIPSSHPSHVQTKLNVFCPHAWSLRRDSVCAGIRVRKDAQGPKSSAGQSISSFDVGAILSRKKLPQEQYSDIHLSTPPSHQRKFQRTSSLPTRKHNNGDEYANTDKQEAEKGSIPACSHI